MAADVPTPCVARALATTVLAYENTQPKNIKHCHFAIACTLVAIISSMFFYHGVQHVIIRYSYAKGKTRYFILKLKENPNIRWEMWHHSQPHVHFFLCYVVRQRHLLIGYKDRNICYRLGASEWIYVCEYFMKLSVRVFVCGYKTLLLHSHKSFPLLPCVD